MNTLRNLTYHITYNASIAEIVSVNVSAEVGNISASRYSCCWLSGAQCSAWCSIGDAVVKQTFGVRWYSAEDSNISTYRPRSGSPGYIPGMCRTVIGVQCGSHTRDECTAGEPLLAGYPESSSIDNVTYSVFTQMAGGARIPTSGPGGNHLLRLSCGQSGLCSVGACSVYSQTTILYDTPIVTQCTVALASEVRAYRMLQHADW